MYTQEITLNSFLQELCPFLNLEILVKFLFYKMTAEYLKSSFLNANKTTGHTFKIMKQLQPSFGTRMRCSCKALLQVIFYLFIFSLLFVTECDDGTYGLNCAQKCGVCRNFVPCNKTDGICQGGCEDGFNGDQCQINGIFA